MRNKKSVLMTLNHNFGCFSGVVGIAGNVGRIGEAREFEIRQLGFVPSALVLPIRC